MTLAAHPRAGRETVDDRHRSTAQRGLVLDELPEHTESGIVDRAGKAMVFRHALHVQIFDTDHPIVAGQVIGHLRAAPPCADRRCACAAWRATAARSPVGCCPSPCA